MAEKIMNPILVLSGQLLFRRIFPCETNESPRECTREFVQYCKIEIFIKKLAHEIHHGQFFTVHSNAFYIVSRKIKIF